MKINNFDAWIMLFLIKMFYKQHPWCAKNGSTHQGSYLSQIPFKTFLSFFFFFVNICTFSSDFLPYFRKSSDKLMFTQLCKCETTHLLCRLPKIAFWVRFIFSMVFHNKSCSIGPKCVQNVYCNPVNVSFHC